MPKQNNPMIAYFNASLASWQGVVASTGTAVRPCNARTLHWPQYFWPCTSTMQLAQNGSAHPAQRPPAATPGWFLHIVELDCAASQDGLSAIGWVGDGSGCGTSA